MSQRRKQQLAAAAGGLVLAIVLVAVLAGGGNSGSGHSISVPAAQIPAGTTDPHARDRTEITALALAFQEAVRQDTPADPCAYLDPQSHAFTIAKARTDYAGGTELCSTAARQLAGYGGGNPPGIDPAAIQFGSSPDQVFDCNAGTTPPSRLPVSQRGMPWAAAPWAGSAGNLVAFVYEHGRWWVDLLLCHD
jgi:hypothetical protein